MPTGRDLRSALGLRTSGFFRYLAFGIRISISMTRPWKTWLVFATCCAVLLAAMGWISVTALQLDRLQQHAAQRADFEELVRLALWRMDSWLTPTIVEETARPASAYRALAPAANAYSKTLAPLRQGDVLVPSPLLAYNSSNVLLHFQLDAAGNITSPQVPPPAQQALAESGYTTPERIHIAAEKLDELRQLLNQSSPAPAPAVASSWSRTDSSAAPRETVVFRKVLFEELPPLPAPFVPWQLVQNFIPNQSAANPDDDSAQTRSQVSSFSANEPPQTNELLIAQNETALALTNAPVNFWVNNGTVGTNNLVIRKGKGQQAEQVQRVMNSTEFYNRRNIMNEQVQRLNYDNNLIQGNGGNMIAPATIPEAQSQERTQTPTQSGVPTLTLPASNSTASLTLKGAPVPQAGDLAPITPVTGVIQPFWLGDALVLARRAETEDGSVVQGCWLNWPSIKSALLDSVRDLLPVADLKPLPKTNGLPESRALAALPVQLVPGESTVLHANGWTPVQTSLGVAWICVFLAGAAAAFLLHGTLALSERRAAFVSAVTHELRTPLTTFKMYSEMLADGMVTEEEKRKNYLSTLCSEANRLNHLVENVLAYARLERGSARSRLERIKLGDLVQRIKPRLVERAAQAGMQVVEDVDEAAARSSVEVDVSVVEQVLFNLVDNACKYAAPTATEQIIHLEAVPENGRFALLRVRDHGQGISAEVAKRMFQPFNKSATEAAHSAPGVGLGLALCRRLSRSMGGDLECEFTAESGASFRLLLPMHAPGGA
jgi:signal transduction histidine kinase